MLTQNPRQRPNHAAKPLLSQSSTRTLDTLLGVMPQLFPISLETSLLVNSILADPVYDDGLQILLLKNETGKLTYLSVMIIDFGLSLLLRVVGAMLDIKRRLRTWRHLQHPTPPNTKLTKLSVQNTQPQAPICDLFLVIDQSPGATPEDLRRHVRRQDHGSLNKRLAASSHDQSSAKQGSRCERSTNVKILLVSTAAN